MAMFQIMEDDDEFIANDSQALKITKLLNKFYSIESELSLDEKNRFQVFKNRAAENMKKANKQSLHTVAACSDEINKILISKH
jgi:hypothetical protein